MTFNIDEYVQAHQAIGDTREDVAKVLSDIGKPGENRAIKREVVARLFKNTSPQGFSVVHTIETYAEY